MSKLSKITGVIRNPKFSSGAVCALVISLILVANMILYVLSGIIGWYSFSPETLDISLESASVDQELRNAQTAAQTGHGSKLKIIFCMDESDIEVHTRGKLVLGTAKQLAEKYSDLIEIEYINIVIERDKIMKYTKNADGTENPIRKETVIFEYGDSGTSFKVVNDSQSTEGYATFYTLAQDMTPTSYNGEEIISAMLLWVMRDKHPTAYFTVGHGESSSASMTAMFACAGYNLQTVNLRDQAGAGLPVGDGNVLVISNPLTDFERGADSSVKTEIEALDAFIQNGGKVYAAIDPYLNIKQLKNLRELFAKYGIEISTVTTDSGAVLSNIVRDTEQSITTDGYTVVTGFADNERAGRIGNLVTSYGTGKVLVREAAAIKTSGNAFPVLITSSTSLCEVGGAVTDRAGSYCVAAASTVSPDATASNGALFVTSNAFLSSDDIVVTNGYSNKDFIYAVMQEIFYAEKPPYGCNGTMLSNTDRLEGLTMSTARIYTVIACLIPAAIAAVGAVIIIRRKNR